VTRPYEHLASVDAVFTTLISQHGRPDPFHWGWAADRPHADAFRVLLLQIVSQHVSTARSFQLFDRLDRAAGGIDPQRILGLGPTGLADVGLPPQKAIAATALAQGMTDGTVDLENLSEDDTRAERQLTALPGIGPWSAHMFLLGYAHRPDILPSGDFGIRRAVANAWGIDPLPSPAAVARRGLAWSPYRSYAAALLWTSVLTPATDEHGEWLGKRAAAGSADTA
jgi:DNA-3-methyladenine glycosylase II